VLPFMIGSWNLTFGQSAVMLLSSGVGAMLGAAFWGWMADRIGRRPVFNLTILNFSLATGALYFTPDNGFWYLTAFRFLVGFGVGGLYCVDLPLVQEFMPARKRGFVGGIVTASSPSASFSAPSPAATSRAWWGGAGCSPSGCCRACWCCWCGCGSRNPRGGCCDRAG